MEKVSHLKIFYCDRKVCNVTDLLMDDLEDSLSMEGKEIAWDRFVQISTPK